MLKRKIDQEFLGFLQGPTKEALLVTGARQVGKTFSVRQFAHRHFQDFVEINFIEHPEAKALFDSVHGTKDFFNRFSAYVGSKTVTQNGNLVVKEKGTLLANAQLNKAFVINPNGSTEATLYVNCPWLNIGKYLGLSILNLLTNNQRLSELARQIYNEPFLLSGYIRAENITIPFNFIQKINASDSEVTV